MWNLERLFSEVICDSKTMIEWLVDKMLIFGEKTCDICLRDMYLNARANKLSVFGRFRCSNRNKHPDHKVRCVSQANGSIFYKTRFSPNKILILMLCFSKDFTVHEAIEKISYSNPKAAYNSVVEWFEFFQEILSNNMVDFKYTESQIGGENVVEIVNAVFRHRTCKLSNNKKGMHIFGLIELGTSRFHIKISGDQLDIDEKIILIKKHVLPSTRIIDDECHLYKSLIETDSYYFSEHASENLVGQKKEFHYSWKKYKSIVYISKTFEEDMADEFLEFLFRRKCKYENLDPFDEFIKVIQSVFSLEQRIANTSCNISNYNHECKTLPTVVRLKKKAK